VFSLIFPILFLVGGILAAAVYIPYHNIFEKRKSCGNLFCGLIITAF
jgi:hypothetical protein